MVGHTHEDIDQVFSCVSLHLMKNALFIPLKVFLCLPLHPTLGIYVLA